MEIKSVASAILIVSLATISIHYYNRTKTLESEKLSLRFELQELKKLSDKTKNDQDIFSRPKISIAERKLFEEQYNLEPKCHNPINDSVMVKCTDDKRKAMFAWVEKNRTTNKPN